MYFSRCLHAPLVVLLFIKVCGILCIEVQMIGGHPTVIDDISMGVFWKDGKYMHHAFNIQMDDIVWYGKVQSSFFDVTPTPKQVAEALEPLKDENMWPEKPRTMIAASPSPVDEYIKIPHVDKLGNKTDQARIREALLHEASILEQIPAHPNIVAYYGCRVNPKNRITGIVLEYHQHSLMDISPMQINPMHIPLKDLDVSTFLAELQSAVDSLHMRGLAHNDINPTNIMLKHGRPILIDFENCRPFGEEIPNGGDNMIGDAIRQSSKENDIKGIEYLKQWFDHILNQTL